MNKPEILIVVVGGIVTSVITPDEVRYDVLYLDEMYNDDIYIVTKPKPGPAGTPQPRPTTKESTNEPFNTNATGNHVPRPQHEMECRAIIKH